MPKNNTPETRCGYVALIGRTNVGKSTFLNSVMQAKISIVSDKPQTTRKRILGIHTTSRGQAVFFDSPGIHQPRSRLNEKMMKDVHMSLRDADLVLYFTEMRDQRDDPFIIDLLRTAGKPVILVINKIDLFRRSRSLERMAAWKDLFPWKEIVPLSALNGINVDRLESLIFDHLPTGAPLFPEDMLTRQSETFYAAELIREQLLQLTHHELPFTTLVVVRELEKNERLVTVTAEILVETRSQKKIIVGKNGAMVKAIGSGARRELEDYFDIKVYLDLHVRISPNWRNTPNVFAEMLEQS
ncbi:MAG: GTPase Era [Acidobacteriota bacterium]|nr:GTPase Era [Acidobacteriota bacterium]